MTPEDLEKKKHPLSTLLDRHEKRLLHRIEKAKADLSLGHRWKELEKEGDLLKAHFPQLKRGMKEITVTDWETEKNLTIRLDTKLLPQEEVALRYHQSKKREKSIPHLQNYISKLEKEVTKFNAIKEDLEKAQTDEELDKIYLMLPHPPNPLEKKEKEIKAALPYKEFISKTGMKIWVGKSAKDNEKLTFSYARGSDWWLHAYGCAGSHVVIRVERGQEPDPETLQEAIQLALTYSKAKSKGEGDICVTQRKFVSRFGQGHVGKVQVSKHKLIYGRL